MKTVSEIVKEYNERNESNKTPMHGFKVGDKVKYAPHAIELFNKDVSGEIIRIADSLVTIEKGIKGSYNLESLQEYYLMPYDSNN